MTGTEVERLIVRLVGDAKGYINSMMESKKASEKFFVEANGRLRDHRVRFAAAQKVIQSETRKSIALLKAYALQLTKFPKTMFAGVRSSLNGMSMHIAIAGTALTGFFGKAVTAASDFEESTSKFSAVFADRTDEVQDWAEETAKATNRSTVEFMNYSSSFADLFHPMGIAREQAAEMAKTLSQLGVDLASFNNVSDEQAIDNLMSAMTGSGEVMKKYGIILTESAVKQRLLMEGLDPSNVTEAQKAMARLNIIMEGTTAAQGDAVRTSEGFENQFKGMKSAIHDLSIEIGQQLLPALTPMVKDISAWIRKTTEATKSTGWFGEKLGTLLDILHTVKIGFKYTQSFVTAFLGGVVSALDKSIETIISLINKIPGVDIQTSGSLATAAEELNKLAEEQRAEAEKLLRDVTPSERIAAAERAARLAEQNAPAPPVAAQNDLLAGLQAELKLREQMKKMAEEQEKVYQDLASQAHSLLLEQMTPLQNLKREIADVESLMYQGALTEAEAQQIIKGKMDAFIAEEGTAKATGGTALLKGSREAYSATTFGQQNRGNEKELKKLLDKTDASVKTEQEIVAQLEQLNRHFVHAPPAQIVSIP